MRALPSQGISYAGDAELPAEGASARAAPAAWRDAIAIAVLVTAMAAVSVHFNLSELLRGWAAPWERFQLDELPGVLCVLALGLTWFAARRHRASVLELRRRRVAERRLAAALAGNRRLAQQYVRLEEAERKTLAQELHDELGQYLNVIKLDGVAIRDDRLGGEENVQERAAAIVANCNHIHAELANLIRRLRPVGLDELGLTAAVEHCVDAWRSRLPGAELRLTTTGELADLPEDVALAVYRVVQEALTNIAKHASAGHIDIRLDREHAGAGIGVTISDDGVGVEPDAPTRGLGLIGMRERVAALQGQIEVASAPGRGFRLTARIPAACAA
ncbi:MAG: sensor histidine kinase [Steroidobacteraceae bacterium]